MMEIKVGYLRQVRPENMLRRSTKGQAMTHLCQEDAGSYGSYKMTDFRRISILNPAYAGAVPHLVDPPYDHPVGSMDRSSILHIGRCLY